MGEWSRSGHAGQAGQSVKRRLPEGIDRLPSGAWRARIMVDGKRTTIGTFPTVEAAKLARNAAAGDVARGTFIEPNRARITLDEFVTDWMPDRPIREITRRNDESRYRLHIRPYLGRTPLNEITPMRVQRWLAALERDGRSDVVRRRAWVLLKTILGPRGAIGDQRRYDNPCAVVSAPNPPHREWTLLTRPEFDRLLTEIPDRYRALVLLGALAGLRWSEAAALTRGDVNTLRGTVSVTKGRPYNGGKEYDGPTKSRRHRTVPLHPELVAALNHHIATYPTDPDGRLFASVQGRTLRQPHFYAGVWQPACERAKVTARFHDLRHSCASWLLDAGATVAEVRDLLGHSSVTVTEGYLHTTDDALRSAVLRLRVAR